MSARAFITGVAGPELSAQERDFLRETRPWGAIIFARNVVDPPQLRRLTGDIKEAVGRDLRIWVDQEGGRVQRLKPPHWTARRPGADFGRLFAHDREAALAAARLNARLIAAELREVAITADCLPCIDTPADGADPIIGDRAFATDPETVAALGAAVLEGLRAGGVCGVVKHIPGHGRADLDSHLALPRVDASAEALSKTDFAPFRRLAHAPAAMTAHVVYSAIDDAAPATTSARVIAEVVRGDIGFDGLLMTDDLSMKALEGSMRARCEAALAAGCDMLLHCNGDMAEMERVAAAAPVLAGDAARRAAAADAWPAAPEPLDREAGELDLARAFAAIDGAGASPATS